MRAAVQSLHYIANAFFLRVWDGHLLQTSLTHCQPTLLVAIVMRISYTARLQANCNPALSQTGYKSEFRHADSCVGTYGSWQRTTDN
jgi:hypothetical protein